MKEYSTGTTCPVIYVPTSDIWVLYIKHITWDIVKTNMLICKLIIKSKWKYFPSFKSLKKIIFFCFVSFYISYYSLLSNITSRASLVIVIELHNNKLNIEQIYEYVEKRNVKLYKLLNLAEDLSISDIKSAP